MRTIYSEQHLRHDPNEILNKEHPYESAEVPARAEIIRAAVEAAGLGPIAPPTDHGFDPILAVHDPGLLDFLQTAHQRVSEYHGQYSPAVPDTFAVRLPEARLPRGIWGQLGYYCFGVGSPIFAGTWDAAYWSAQCALTGADELLNGEGARQVYALCRPPGHHAARDLYGGFCFLNNAAIAARHLQSAGGEAAARIAILDFDYHHGNGTQAIFYADPSVLFCSLHADPEDEYPHYWGYADQTGAGPGEGCTRNFPLPLGTPDGPYLEALAQANEAIQDYAPDYLIVSAGFDIFTGDPVGGFNVSTEGIAQVGRAVAALGLPTLIVQEGGYLRDTLGENAVAFLEQF